MPSADVTIVMSHYNHAKFLPRALDALLSQTVRPREIVLIDDASPDNGLDIMESYARRDPSIRIIRNEQNLGVVASFNRLVKEVKTEYIGAAAADDYVLPGWVEKSMAVLQSHPEAGLACSYHSTVDEDTGKIASNPSQWCKEPAYFSPERLADVIGFCNIASTTAIYKTASVVKAGGYPSELKWYSDWFMNAVIAFREGICHIPETLALVCVKSESYSTGRERDREQHIEVLGNMLNKVLSPELVDVISFFRRSGTLATFGPDVIRAAARRPDWRTVDVLSLINGFSQYSEPEFANDDDSKVQEIVSFLRERQWIAHGRQEHLAYLERLIEQAVQDRDQARDHARDEIRRIIDQSNRDCEFLRSELELARKEIKETHDIINRMEASFFWKLRGKIARVRRACMKALGKSR